MNKKLVIFSLVITVILGGALAVGASNIDPKKDSKASVNQMMTEEEIKSIALAEYPGKIEEIDLEKIKGNSFYEVEIETENSEVELKIDAFTGNILGVDVKEKKTSVAVAPSVQQQTGNDDQLDEKADVKIQEQAPVGKVEANKTDDRFDDNADDKNEDNKEEIKQTVKLPEQKKTEQTIKTVEKIKPAPNTQPAKSKKHHDDDDRYDD